MTTKLYAGSLSNMIDNNGLEHLFAQYGKVSSAQVIMDRISGRSKGFGFIEMDNDTEAQAAISALNGREIDGKVLIVNKAQPKGEQSGPRKGGAFGGRERGRSGGRYY